MYVGLGLSAAKDLANSCQLMICSENALRSHGYKPNECPLSRKAWATLKSKGQSQQEVSWVLNFYPLVSNSSLMRRNAGGTPLFVVECEVKIGRR